MRPNRRATLTDKALTAIGALGIAAIFVPFGRDTGSLYSVLIEETYAVLAAPFILTIPILLANTYWVRAGRLPNVATTLVYAVAALSAGATSWCLGSGFWIVWSDTDPPPATLQDWVFLLIPTTILGAGLSLAVVDAVRSGYRAANPIVAAQMAFMANAALCLAIVWAGFWQTPSIKHWSIGAYLTIATCAAYATQIWRAFERRDGRAEPA